MSAICVSRISAAQAAANSVGEAHGHVDLVLNAAGILHIPGVMSPGASHFLQPSSPEDNHIILAALNGLNANAETSLTRVTPENLLRNFQINAFGPILVGKVKHAVCA